MNDARNIVLHMLEERHDPEAVLAYLEAHIMEAQDGAEGVQDVIVAAVAMNQLVHQFGHLIPRLDAMLDTMVAAGPDALNADVMEDLDPDRFHSEEYAREVFTEYTEGTDPQDRVWTTTTLPNGLKAVSLDGPDFNARVLAFHGASDADVEEFKDKMIRMERDTK